MKSNEWYTPEKYLQAARKVMGSIELDPASCELANTLVQAERFYTKEENGLLQDWKAKTVWLNPPYARNADYQSGIRSWVEKVVKGYQSGAIQQAILLVTTELNAPWFQPLYDYLICSTNHRVKFIALQKNKRRVYSHMFGSCFVYFGPNKHAFITQFSQFGRILQAVDTPAIQPHYQELWEVS